MDQVIDDRAREWFRSFDIVCSFMHDPGHLFKEVCDPASERCLFSQRAGYNDARNQHASYTILGPLIKLGFIPAADFPWLKFRCALPIVPDYICIHPSSGNTGNNYPMEFWHRVVSRTLKLSSSDIVITGTDHDAKRTHELVNTYAYSNRVSLVENAPLTVLALLLAGCRGYLGQDSGVSHLASAVNARSTVFWGSAYIETWKPAGQHVFISKTDDIPDEHFMFR